MSVKFDLNIDSKEWKEFKPRPIIKNALAEIAKYEDIDACEVSILLTNDVAIQVLNSDYRGFDKPTNVLSFPQDDEVLLGDIAMAYETLAREAGEQDKTFHDHFTHLFVHGVLHLLGYDHEEKHDQEDMEKQEINILHGLGIQNPYV
jgi:probable rRNA maturation factor